MFNNTNSTKKLLTEQLRSEVNNMSNQHRLLYICMNNAPGQPLTAASCEVSVKNINFVLLGGDKVVCADAYALRLLLGTGREIDHSLTHSQGASNTAAQREYTVVQPATGPRREIPPPPPSPVDTDEEDFLQLLRSRDDGTVLIERAYISPTERSLHEASSDDENVPRRRRSGVKRRLFHGAAA